MTKSERDELKVLAGTYATQCAAGDVNLATEAAYHDAANPQTVIALLDALDRLTKCEFARPDDDWTCRDEGNPVEWCQGCLNAVEVQEESK